jgi:hypothetical protein
MAGRQLLYWIDLRSRLTKLHHQAPYSAKSAGNPAVAALNVTGKP